MVTAEDLLPTYSSEVNVLKCPTSELSDHVTHLLMSLAQTRQTKSETHLRDRNSIEVQRANFDLLEEEVEL